LTDAPKTCESLQQLLLIDKNSDFVNQNLVLQILLKPVILWLKVVESHRCWYR